MSKRNFDYRWTLKDAVFTKDKGKVFSCFACGGGSTMGYKRSGFDVIGCNEIDPKMADCYSHNHHPKYLFLEPIQLFKLRDTEENLIKKYGFENYKTMNGKNLLMPDELYNLDILDGSPPCSSFSMAGNRSEDWGKDKVFREGQAKQVLDTLFFDFIDVAEKLQPKVVVAENVRGLMMGDAIQYVRRIYDAFEKAGYNVQHWLLDASKMGVPQKRERVFFVALRNDLCGKFIYQKDLFTHAPMLDLDFDEPEIPFSMCTNNEEASDKKISEIALKYWHLTKKGSDFSEAAGGSYFNWIRLNDAAPTRTLHTRGEIIYHPDVCRPISDVEFALCSSFPSDYDYRKMKTAYICGMSVPPVMTAQVAKRIYDQWLSKL